MNRSYFISSLRTDIPSQKTSIAPEKKVVGWCILSCLGFGLFSRGAGGDFSFSEGIASCYEKVVEFHMTRKVLISFVQKFCLTRKILVRP